MLTGIASLYGLSGRICTSSGVLFFSGVLVFVGVSRGVMFKLRLVLSVLSFLVSF